MIKGLFNSFGIKSSVINTSHLSQSVYVDFLILPGISLTILVNSWFSETFVHLIQWWELNDTLSLSRVTAWYTSSASEMVFLSACVESMDADGNGV